MHVIFKSVCWRFVLLCLNVFQAFSFIFLMAFCACNTFLLGLSYSTDDNRLREAFSSYGEVVEGVSPFHCCFL